MNDRNPHDPCLRVEAATFMIGSTTLLHDIDHPVTVASRERQVVQDDEDQRTLPSEPQGTCHDGFLVAQVERRRWLIQ